MKKLIIIGGDLAAGKSTFSKRLTDELEIVSINKDTIKEILGDNFGFSNREENLKLSKCSFDLMLHMANIIMDSNNSFILESNFRQHELDKLVILAKEYKYEILSLVLEGDLHILHERFNKRINGDRHIVHKSQDLSKYEDFYNLSMNMRNVVFPGKVMKIDVTDFNTLYSNETILKIKDFYYR